MTKKVASSAVSYSSTKCLATSILAVTTTPKWSRDCTCRDTVLTLRTKSTTSVSETSAILSTSRRISERSLTLSWTAATSSKTSLCSRAWWISWDPIVCLLITSLRSARLTTWTKHQVAMSRHRIHHRSSRPSNSDLRRQSRLKAACQPYSLDMSCLRLGFSILWVYNRSPPSSSASAQSSAASTRSAVSSKVYWGTVWVFLSLGSRMLGRRLRATKDWATQCAKSEETTKMNSRE